MHVPEKCPFCGSSKVLAGKVISNAGNYGFRPYEVSGFHFTFRVVFAFEFGPQACYCAKCSMVWSKADPKDAADFIENFADDELKQKLAAEERPPTAPPPSSPPPSNPGS